MSKSIVIGQSAAGNVAIDLDVLISTRLLIQANSGAGKSHLLRRLMEQLFPHVQVIAIDPEGEFATLREKFGFVLVGKGGETPADVRSAAELAEKLLALNASAVCDLYEMRAPDRHAWVKAFLDAMIDAPKKLWHPCVVIVDEAHIFCPESKAGDSVAKQSMNDLTSRGRKRGFCAVWATQRLANVDKSSTSLLQNRIIGGTFEDVDIKRALDLLSVAPEDKLAFTKQLRTLEPGWFYGFGRAIATERVLFKSGKVQTTHVQPGSQKHAAEPPPTPDKIKKLLPQLADLPQQAQEKAKTNADLQKRVRELEKDLREAKKQQPSPAVTKASKVSKAELREAASAAVKTLHIPLVKTLREVRDVYRKGRTQFDRLREEMDRTYKAFSPEAMPPLTDELLDIKNTQGKVAALLEGAMFKTPLKAFAPLVDSRVPAVPVKSSPAPTPTHPPTDGAKLKDGPRRILAVLAQDPDNHLSYAQVRVLAGIKATRTLQEYLRQLAATGAIAKDGGSIALTESGLALAEAHGVVGSAPTSTADVLAIWRPKLKDGPRRILDALLTVNGHGMDREQVKALAGINAERTLQEYLRQLRAAKLIVDADGGNIAANKETLFL